MNEYEIYTPSEDEVEYKTKELEYQTKGITDCDTKELLIKNN